MNGSEHRDIGDSASGGAVVNLGGESVQERFLLGYGDVMALSGDYFMPGELFGLARVRGAQGIRPGTRDEIVCALKVMAVDEAFFDSRFEAGGEFADFRFSCRASSSDVERRVRDRYLELAATNDDHFVVSGGVTHERPGGPRPFGSAIVAYRRFHQVALEQACRLGRGRGDLSAAMGRETALLDRCLDGGAHAHAGRCDPGFGTPGTRRSGRTCSAGSPRTPPRP